MLMVKQPISMLASGCLRSGHSYFEDSCLLDGNSWAWGVAFGLSQFPAQFLTTAGLGVVCLSWGWEFGGHLRNPCLWPRLQYPLNPSISPQVRFPVVRGREAEETTSQVL